MTHIDRIQVTSVFVSDQDKAHAFYVDKLGLAVRVDMQMPQFRWLEVAPDGGEASLSLMPAFPGSPQPGVQTGIIFNTTDIDADFKALKAQGVTFTQEPTRQPWGGTEARFTDPDGNGFSLVQRGDA